MWLGFNTASADYGRLFLTFRRADLAPVLESMKHVRDNFDV
jgi:hypothetical protein